MTPVVPGAVVQVMPGAGAFGGCLVLVEDVKSWGVIGFVEIPGAGRAYCRIPAHHLTYVGLAPWVPAREREAPPEVT